MVPRFFCDSGHIAWARTAGYQAGNALNDKITVPVDNWAIPFYGISQTLVGGSWGLSSELILSAAVPGWIVRAGEHGFTHDWRYSLNNILFKTVSSTIWWFLSPDCCFSMVVFGSEWIVPGLRPVSRAVNTLVSAFLWWWQWSCFHFQEFSLWR